MRNSQRLGDGRFGSGFDPKGLVELVRAVVAYVLEHPAECGLRPTAIRAHQTAAVSQATFNRARAAAGFPDAPTATSICQRLSRSWLDIVALAQSEATRGVEIALGQRGSAAANFVAGIGFSRGDIVDSLRGASFRLGVAAPTDSAYDEDRAALLRKSRRRAHGGVALAALHPSSSQIVRVAGSWMEALRWAGVTEPPRAHPPTPQARVVIEVFLELVGALPQKLMTAALAKAAGISITGMKKHQAEVESLRAERTRGGLWTPPRVLPLDSHVGAG